MCIVKTDVHIGSSLIIPLSYHLVSGFHCSRVHTQAITYVAEASELQLHFVAADNYIWEHVHAGLSKVHSSIRLWDSARTDIRTLQKDHFHLESHAHCGKNLAAKCHLH